MTPDENPRPRLAMISRTEALTALASGPSQGLTAKEVYFAARPPCGDADLATGGSAYAHRTLAGLVHEGLAETCGPDTRPKRFRAKAEVIFNGVDEPVAEKGLATEPARGRPPVPAPATSASAAGLPDRSRADRPADDGPDRIANALLRMLQAPKPGSRAEIVKIQAAEGISWARAAGLDDLAIAAEIVAATGLAATAGEIVHLVAGMPTRPHRTAG